MSEAGLNVLEETNVAKIQERTYPHSILILAIGLAIFAYNLYVNRFFFHDDAFISLRYALNYVAAGDLSWNLGDKVEGYTNFLHLISVAELMRAGVDPVVSTRVVNAISAIALVAAAFLGAFGIAPGRDHQSARILVIVGVMASISVPVWILGGLETLMVAALLCWGVVSLLPCFKKETPEALGRCALAGVFFAMAYLTRPDAVIMTAMAGFGVFLFGRATFSRRFLQAFIVGIIPLAVIAVHVFWRQGYYGDVLPNTYYAKVGVDSATRLGGVVKYFITAGIYFLPAVSIALGGFLVVLLRHGPLSTLGRQSIFLVLCILGHAGYVFWSGGDHMPAARVLVGVLGPACVLMAAGTSAFPQKLRLPAIYFAIATFVIGPAMITPYKMNPAAYIGLIVGDHIDENWPDDASIALNTAGSTPFQAPNRYYIDMLGLNEREIAKREDVPIRAKKQTLIGHSKGDGAVVMSKQPDFIIMGPAEGRDASDPWFLSDLEISEDPEFARCYAKRVDSLDYSMPEAARIAYVDNPLIFTYYQRTCD